MSTKKKIENKIAEKVAAKIDSTSTSAPKKKKKKKSWADVVHKAISVAGSLVPTVLPFLLGNHGPTAALAAKNPGMFSGIAASGSAPLATSSPLGNLTGMKAMSVTQRDSRGNVLKVRIRTMDLLTPLPNSAFSAGDVMGSFQLSPQDPVFEGTKFAEFASQYERWQLKAASFVYEPTVPATAVGAISACVFDDPTVDVSNLGVGAGLRTVGSQSGSDTFQIWAAGAFLAPPSDVLYTEPNGGDLRLTSAGVVGIVAATAIAGSVTPGNLYFIADTEFAIPSLADNINEGAALRFEDTTTQTPPTVNKPFVVLSTEVIEMGGSDLQFLVSGSWTNVGTAEVGNVIKGLPAGDWFVWMQNQGSTVTAAATIRLPDEAVAAGCTLGLQSSAQLGLSTFSSGRSMCACTLSVPATCPSTVPQLGFFALSAANQLNATLFIAKIPEDLWSADSLLGAVHYRSGVTGRFGPLQAKRRNDFLARTLQGIQAENALQVTRLAGQLADLQRRVKNDEDALLPPNIVSADDQAVKLPAVSSSSLSAPAMAVVDDSPPCAQCGVAAAESVKANGSSVLCRCGRKFIGGARIRGKRHDLENPCLHKYTSTGVSGTFCNVCDARVAPPN